MNIDAKNISTYIILILLIGLLVSCVDSEKSTDTLLIQIEHQRAISNSARRTLETEWERTQEEVYFSVIYTGDIDEILSNSSSHLGALIQDYEFQITAPFEIDETMKGIILRRFDALPDPVTVAKELSLCEEVLMVEVKNTSQQVL